MCVRVCGGEGVGGGVWPIHPLRIIHLPTTPLPKIPTYTQGIASSWCSSRWPTTWRGGSSTTSSRAPTGACREKRPSHCDDRLRCHRSIDGPTQQPTRPTPTTKHNHNLRRYTALGGLQFDKDLRCILTAFPQSSSSAASAAGYAYACCPRTEQPAYTYIHMYIYTPTHPPLSLTHHHHNTHQTMTQAPRPRRLRRRGRPRELCPAAAGGAASHARRALGRGGAVRGARGQQQPAVAHAAGARGERWGWRGACGVGAVDGGGGGGRVVSAGGLGARGGGARGAGATAAAAALVGGGGGRHGAVRWMGGWWAG